MSLKALAFESFCPSKTFLCGEYGVLSGGEAIVVNHKPLFGLKVYKSETVRGQEKWPDWAHPQSPSGKLYEAHRSALKDYDLEFYDPHFGKGGFGASGAQFILLYRFLNQLKGVHFPSSVFEHFKSQDSSSSSGADILSQDLGEGFMHIDTREKRAVALLAWPFSDLEYAICPTGKKLNTFGHLESLPDTDFEVLKGISKSVIKAYQDFDEDLFLKELKNFQNRLMENDLVAPHTLDFLKTINKTNGVLFTKGCGALGSDSLFIIYKRENSKDLNQCLETLGLTTISHSGSV